MDQQYWHLVELWRCGYRTLYAEVGERLLVVFVSAGITDLYAKHRLTEEALDCRVVWLSRQIQGIRNEKNQRVLITDLGNLLRLFSEPGCRKNLDNTLILMVHAAVSHVGVARIKQLLPGVRVVSYIYDFMDLMVPETEIEAWKEFHGGTAARAKLEYDYLKAIRTGKLADAVLYKDHGPNWNYMRECSVPSMWLPQSLPRGLFQIPPNPSVPDSFCFIGTIVPKETHKKESGLFDDIMMEDIFAEVADQGFRIHAYVLNPDHRVIEEYRKLFPGGMVKLFKGDILDHLLPRLRGRYRWGWMLYRYPKDIVMGMVKETLPTKFYTYLALGVPPVVSSEMKAVCKLVEKYGCGVVVKREELRNLRQVLSRYDYPALQRGILRAREELSIDVHWPKVIKLFRKVLGRKPRVVEPFYTAVEAAEVSLPSQTSYASAVGALGKG